MTMIKDSNAPQESMATFLSKTLLFDSEVGEHEFVEDMNETLS